MGGYWDEQVAVGAAAWLTVLASVLMCRAVTSKCVDSVLDRALDVRFAEGVGSGLVGRCMQHALLAALPACVARCIIAHLVGEATVYIVHIICN